MSELPSAMFLIADGSEFRFARVYIVCEEVPLGTPESPPIVSGVEAAVNAVVRDKNITEQTEVDAMAKAIEDAIAALQYKDADYTKVDAAIAKANALNKNDYKDFSGVEAAVKAVVRGKNIAEQSEVDKMAKTIEDAIAALEKKPASTKPGTSDKSPQAGDTSNLALWIALLFISGGAAIGTTVVSRKKKYNR